MTVEKFFQQITDFIREIFKQPQGFIPLHEPRFIGKEKEYLSRVIDSTFVSSVGEFVNLFEKKIAEYTGSKYAVAVVNGTSALHLALLVSGVKPQEEVITQPLTFVATANAIKYIGAHPVFIDVYPETFSLDPQKLEDFLRDNSLIKQIDKKTVCINKITGRRIAACVPVHTFGHPAVIDEIISVCDKYFIPVIEDAAESLGSFYKGKHTGTFGLAGIISFNGNKIITTGNGGMILTDDQDFASLARHLSTQAKVPHPWEYIHDQVGYNYRMSNLQAALGLAQLDKLEFFVERKRWLAEKYKEFFSSLPDIDFLCEPKNSRSNYWLNAILLPDLNFKNKFLKFTNKNEIQTRSVWKLLSDLDVFKDELVVSDFIARDLYNRTVNIPSSVIL